MSAQDVQTEILEPMQRLFLSPRKMDEADQEAALREYVSHLQHFERQDLRVAWHEVVETHQNRSWPIPSQIIKAAKEAYRERASANKAPIRHGKSDHAVFWDRWRVVRQSGLAKEAARLGVAWSLKCAIVNDGKEAGQIVLADLVEAKHRASQTAEKIDKGLPIDFKGRTLRFTFKDGAEPMRLWKNLLVKEEETRAEIMAA